MQFHLFPKPAKRINYFGIFYYKIETKRAQKNTRLTKSPDFSKVKDVYMIAVEDETKRRLEKLSQFNSIKPVDMTKLSNDDDSTKDNSTVNSTVSVNSGVEHFGNDRVEMSDMNGLLEREPPKKGDKSRKDSKSSKSSSIGNLDTLPLGEHRSQNSNNQSLEHVEKIPSYDDGSINDQLGHMSFEVEDNGPYREMAIDCPDNFPSMSKSPPRLPNSKNNSIHSSPRSSGKEQMKSKNISPGKIPNGHNSPSITDEQMERMRKHQEDLRKRREEENQRAKEQEFLRTSLRGSKKLQALEKKRQMAEGFVNTAFDENSDDFDSLDNGIDRGMHSPTDRERYMKKNVAMEDLFSCLQHISFTLNAKDSSEVTFLNSLFHNDQFQQAVKLHNTVVDVTTASPPPRPELTNAHQISNEVMSDLQYNNSAYASDLMEIMSKPGFKNLLNAHDLIVEQEMRPRESSQEDEFLNQPLAPYGEESIKIIHLEKTHEPLGATVRNDGDSVVIGRIVKGGTAERSGMLHEGDEILEVNSIDMKGKNINDVSEMLANMTGTITFMIVPGASLDYKPSPRQDQVVHLKALFNYDPEEDIFIPCRELGISFMKGEILHVISMEDPSWWQAYREGEEEHQTLAGLIPSRTFQEQREANKRTLANENKENNKRSRSCACGRKDKRKRKKSLYSESDEVLTYEEVEMYYPQPNRKRPIVLIGPPNVGRHELRQRLMESDYERFAAAIPHTSRPKMENELNGRDYHFVPRAIFEADIMSNKFVEHGEYEKNLYGTSLDAIRQVINAGKICILNLHAESLRLIKNSDLKPYVIFVYPPNLEKLRKIQKSIGVAKVTDEDLKEIIERAREMEDRYGHYFDFILVNSDMDSAYEELLAEINRLEVEPQWVPIQWMDS
ncbi:hypothetical protein FSP39_004425 [Pinctada imbricata]|uniref:MAGUK p55 subfamily member 5 n=1 Tax=Pinctada imbricata TaxID=66713 RepID=A0AA89BVN9_PINIB|nr:hypothetical protein FSP39_004425 [Pinctada imbricata]